ncbi:MAG: ComF family protein [Methylococcaceae bacterium]|nr:ComF family protein [Methylococcaceae bacterium]
MNKWLESIQEWLYPGSCLLCGGPGSDRLDLCSACRADLPVILHACARCGIPLEAEFGGAVCGACLKKPPAMDSTVALFRYEEPLRLLIHELKFRHQLAVARLLGELLAASMARRETAPQVLIPVPLHPRRFRERGFNQSTEIARIVSRRLGIPLDSRSCCRIRLTAPQTTLPAEQRRRNIRNAFRIDGRPNFGHAAIVDDIVTTGATVNELARTLRRAGARRIEVWAIARA